MNKSNKGEKMDRLEDNTIKSNLIINNIETSTNIKEYYVILSILEGYLNMINVQHKIIKKNKRFLIESLLIYYNMVPEAGLEPAHSEEFQILSLVRLPIPPLRHFLAHLAGVEPTTL